MKKQESESHVFLKRPQKQRCRETQEQNTYREMLSVKNATANSEIRVPFCTTSNVQINSYTKWTKFNWLLRNSNNLNVRRIINYSRGNWTQNKFSFKKISAWWLIWNYRNIINHITENMNCNAANNNKSNNRKCSSLHSSTFSSKYTGSIRVRYYAKYVKWEL